MRKKKRKDRAEGGWKRLNESAKRCSDGSPKPPPLEDVKSNPSKRHRDRLNQELNKLAGLLPFPEDVRSRLDKLSILRLAVGYLKVKSYLLATAMDVGDSVLEHPRALGGSRWMEPQVNRELFPEGEMLLQALNGFVIAVTGDGSIFYVSPTVQDYLGFHQSDLIHRSVYELIHVDDRAAFHHELHRAPVSSSSQHVMKTGESGLEVFRLLTKKGAWVWVQGSARLVYKGGKPDCIIAQQRALSDEEGEEHLWKRNLQLPLTFVTGEAILHRNDLPEPLDSLQAKEEPQTPADSQPKQCLVGANPLQGPMMKQDASEYSSLADNVLQLVAELDGLSGDEGASDAKDSDSVLVIAETVFEKSEEDGNVSWTMQNLNMAAAELQQWEDALLSLGAEEKSPVQEVGTEVTSFMEQMLLGQDAGKSMAFPPCSEEDDAAAHLQHCWAAPSVFQAAAQPQARGAQGQDAVVPLVSISSAQPEQHVLSNPAGLVGGTVVDAPLEVAKPGQGLQAAVPTSAAMDNPVPNDGMQPGGELMDLLHSK
ncbi:aryl hydrocarbon receptor-like [Amazona ochrocephala]